MKDYHQKVDGTLQMKNKKDKQKNCCTSRNKRQMTLARTMLSNLQFKGYSLINQKTAAGRK